MKILVTGGAGFIGSNIQDRLIQEGHQVVVVDDLFSGRKEYINPKAKFYKVDIQTKDLEQVFAKERPEVVDHHAAHINVRESVKNPIFDAQVNILGTINLLENCKKYKVKKIIFASTGGALYGDTDVIPTPEDHPTKPVSPYGVTKLCTECYLYYYKQVHGLDYVILRYANVYGPRQDPYGEAGVVAIFTQKLLANEQPIINGDGKQTRDYVFVEDVVDSNMLALTYKRSDIYNVGTGKETSVNELFRKLVDITGVSKPEKHGPPMPGEQRKSCLSFTKIKEKLGWKPKTGLDEGLEKTVEWFKNQLT